METKRVGGEAWVPPHYLGREKGRSKSGLMGTGEGPCNLLLCSPTKGAGGGQGLGRAFQGREAKGGQREWGWGGVLSGCECL